MIRRSVGPRTQLACANPEGTMGQEAAYLGLMGSVTQYRYENRSLCLLAPGETQDQVLLEYPRRQARGGILFPLPGRGSTR